MQNPRQGGYPYRSFSVLSTQDGPSIRENGCSSLFAREYKLLLETTKQNDATRRRVDHRCLLSYHDCAVPQNLLQHAQAFFAPLVGCPILA